jgi:hypothetical protein
VGEGTRRRLSLTFAAAALPTVFVLGMLTTAPLVDTGIQNVLYLSSVTRIRGYYRKLGPEAAHYFARWGAGDGETEDALRSLAVESGPLAGLFTAAACLIVFFRYQHRRYLSVQR